MTKDGKLGPWNIIVAGKKNKTNGEWRLPNGSVVNKVTRTRKRPQSDFEEAVLNIGVLRDPRDLLADIDLDAVVKSDTREEIIKFIESVTSKKGDMDKKAIEASLKAAGLDNKEIEGMMDDCDKKLAENGQLADSMKLPLVPAIFTLKDGKATMLRLSSAEQLLPAIEAATK